MKLWFDDMRPAPEGWRWIKSGEVLVCYIYYYQGEIEELSMDHDLGKHYDGHDVISFLEEEVETGHLRQMPKIKVHSANPEGRRRMEAAVRNIERMLSGEE